MENVANINEVRAQNSRSEAISRSDASRFEQFIREFELEALELEEEFGVEFPRRHLRDRGNPLEMFKRPGAFR